MSVHSSDFFVLAITPAVWARPRPCENPANFCKQSRRAKFFAILSLPSGLRARKSEQNRSVSKRAGVFTQARPKGDLQGRPMNVREARESGLRLGPNWDSIVTDPNCPGQC